MASKRKVIIVENLSRVFKVGDSEIHALNNLSFDVDEGELVIILGQSGAGKTTLLNIIGGMDQATSGKLIVDDIDITKYNKKQLTDYRRNYVGFVFQFYNLMSNLTALENVELSVEMCKDAYSPKDILEKVGLKERMNNFPGQLSGGEQQRVSIARAVAKNPRILLCDEPTGALDYNTGKQILSLLSNMCKEERKTVIIVTHNSAIKDMADKVVYIRNGSVEKVQINENPKKIEEIEW